MHHLIWRSFYFIHQNTSYFNSNSSNSSPSINLSSRQIIMGNEKIHVPEIASLSDMHMQILCNKSCEFFLSKKRRKMLQWGKQRTQCGSKLCRNGSAGTMWSTRNMEIRTSKINYPCEVQYLTCNSNQMGIKEDQGCLLCREKGSLWHTFYLVTKKKLHRGPYKKKWAALYYTCEQNGRKNVRKKMSFISLRTS